MFKVCNDWSNFLLLAVSFINCLKCENCSTLEDLPVHETDPDFALIDDMILAPEQYDVLYNNITRRTGYIQAVRIWPNATVPYHLDRNFTAAEKSLIRTAQNKIQKATCVKFERVLDIHKAKNYVHIKPGYGCASTVGFWGGKQIVYLQKSGCMDIGRILHEFIHVLGFFHMHTATDRDKYVDIQWANIVPASVLNFAGYESELSMYGTEYDYESITHYPANAFSRNEMPTIISKQSEGDKVMGQRTHLSTGDITRLNRMYNCA